MIPSARVRRPLAAGTCRPGGEADGSRQPPARHRLDLGRRSLGAAFAAALPPWASGIPT